MTDCINITQDWPSSKAPEGYRLNMELRGAHFTQVMELADWLEAHSWFDEATAIREYDWTTFKIIYEPENDGFLYKMDLQGATYVELQEFADWLEARSWLTEATAIREHHFEDHNREGV